MNKDEFKPLPFWQEIFLKKEELQEYYIKKREYQYNNNKHLKWNGIRSALHPVLLGLMSFARKYINKQTLEIINDKRDKNNEKTNKPVIYAITHVGMYDIQIVSEAIKDHQYTFLGDPETMYRTSDGFLMNLNGLVYCDTDNKNDRNIAKKTSIDVLNKGINLMIYPEGVWNLSPNLLTLPLFPGIIDIAMETGCDIIPVAIEQYDNDFVVNIGKNIDVNPEKKEFIDINKKREHIETQKEILRDTLATLKWEIMETRPIEQRKKYGKYEEEYRNFVEKRYKEWVDPKTKVPFYNDEIVEKRTFKPKNICVAKKAFEHLNHLTINRNNAFLFRNYSGTPSEIESSINERIKR